MEKIPTKIFIEGKPVLNLYDTGEAFYYSERKYAPIRKFIGGMGDKTRLQLVQELNKFVNSLIGDANTKLLKYKKIV